MQIAIIGGGLSGLAAAYKLSKNPKNKITVFEKDKKIGGMLGSYRVDNFNIEEYYHHIFLSDAKLITLMQELGLENKLKWNLARNGYYINGKIYSLNTPWDFLSLPNFGLSDFVKLAFLVLKIKKTSDFEALDGIKAEEWIIKNSNENVWNSFVSPLLQSKFGKNYHNISAAWFIKRIQIRAHRKWNGEILGYMEGGFCQLIESLKEKIIVAGGKVLSGVLAEKITVKDNTAAGIVLAGKEISFDKIIYTGSGDLFKKIAPEKTDLPPVKYQGTVCALLSLKEKLTDGVYWLNIKDAEIPFRALIEHTNFIPETNYNNEHLVYLTYYFQDSGDELARMEEEKISALYLEKLSELFPNFDKNRLNWWKIKKEFPTAPVYETGYLKNIMPYKGKIKNLYFAGINSQRNYPERSIQGSILTGFDISDIISS